MKSLFSSRRLWLSAVFFAAMPLPGFAADKLDPKNFDIVPPLDGQLDESEARAYAIHQVSAIHAKYDTNFNGRIDPDEAKEIDLDAAADAKGRRAALELVRQRKHTVSFADAKAAEYKEPVPPKAKLLFGHLLLRRAFEDLVYLNSPTAFKKASGATIGFSNDRLAGKRTREVHGVIYYPVRHSGSAGGTGYFVGGTATAIGLGADMMQNKANPGSDFDLVTARVLHEVEVRGGPENLPSMYFRVSPFFATDARTDSKQGGLKLQWEPLVDLLGGQGVAARLVPEIPLEVRTRWIFQGEGGRVFDAGTKIGLKADEYFWRSGPKIKTEFFCPVPPFHRAALNFSWQYLSGRGTGLHDAHLMETTLTLPLDPPGHATFELTYRKGQDPTNGGARTDSLVLSTGVKY